jgi:hypothetical protein
VAAAGVRAVLGFCRGAARLAAGGGRLGAAAAVRHRRRRPGVPAAWRHACPDRFMAVGARAAVAVRASGDRPVHPRQPGAGLPARRGCGAVAVRAARRRGAHRGRRVAQRAALPAHRGRRRLAGRRGPGRGHRARQHAGPGPRAGCRAGVAGRHADFAAGRRDRAAQLPAGRRRDRVAGRGQPGGSGLMRGMFDTFQSRPSDCLSVPSKSG